LKPSCPIDVFVDLISNEVFDSVVSPIDVVVAGIFIEVPDNGVIESQLTVVIAEDNHLLPAVPNSLILVEFGVIFDVVIACKVEEPETVKLPSVPTDVSELVKILLPSVPTDSALFTPMLNC
jgi:hypothetical protein